MIWKHHLKRRFSIIKDFDSDAPTHPQENTSHTQKTCHSADISSTKFCAHWNKQNSSWGKWREQEYTSSPAELPKQCSHDWLLSPIATACLIGLKYPFHVPLRCYFIHSLKTDHKILLRHREKLGTSRFPLDVLAVNKNSSVKSFRDPYKRHCHWSYIHLEHFIRTALSNLFLNSDILLLPWMETGTVLCLQWLYDKFLMSLLRKKTEGL